MKKAKNDHPAKDAANEKRPPASSPAEKKQAKAKPQSKKAEKPKTEAKKQPKTANAPAMRPQPEKPKQKKPEAVKEKADPAKKPAEEPKKQQKGAAGQEDKVRKTSLRWSDGMMIHMEVHSHLLSTAATAKAYAEHGYPDRYVIISESTDFLEKPRAGAKRNSTAIRISMILRPSIFPSQAAILTPLAATALAENLAGYTAKRVGVGWTSGVYCDGKAIGGITVETKLDNFLTYEYIILTFDFRLPAADFPPKMSDLIRQVFEPMSMSSSAAVMAVSLMQHFFPLYSLIKTPAPIIEKYRSLFLLRGQKCKLLRDGKWVSGRIIDVDRQNAGLIVEVKGEEPKTLTATSGVKLPSKIYFRKRP